MAANKNSNRFNLLKTSLERWFRENTDAANKLAQLDLLGSGRGNKKKKLSLRKIDFLCTTLAKTQHIVYMHKNESINLATEYEQAMFTHKKQQMSAFKRAQRYEFDINGATIVSTIGQINFFRWLFDIGAIHYAMDHIDEIEKEMKTVSKKTKTITDNKGGRGKKRKAQTACFIFRGKQPKSDTTLIYDGQEIATATDPPHLPFTARQPQVPQPATN